MEQCRLGCRVGVVLQALAVALAVGADDPPVLVAPEVDLALAAGEGSGGELLDEAVVMRAQALEDGYKGAEAGGGDYVGRVLVGLQEDGHDDPGDLRGAVFVEPQGAADVLDDFDLGSAGVGEADGFDAAFAGDVDSFAEDAYGGEEGPVYAPVVGVDAVGELPRTSRRSVTRWSPHSQADQTRFGGTWRPASSS